MTIREAMELYQKARSLADHFGNIEKRCPLCREAVGICDLTVADCGHIACHECTISYEDATCCRKCAAELEGA